jgi:glycosyltransferase involved in cell wall biosynthesis
MKIAVLAFSSVPKDIGGAQIFTLNLVRHLLKRGHEVHLHLPRKYVKAMAGFAAGWPRFKVIPIFGFENGFIRYLPWVLQAVLLGRHWRNRYDVWQVIGAYPAAFAARWLGKRARIVMRSYGADIQKEASLGYGLRLDARLDRRIADILPRMSHLVALTPTVKDCYLELGALPAKISEISNAIEYSRFRFPIDKERIRSQLGIKPEEIFLLSTGRYHLKKGYEVIPEAAEILLRRGFAIRWLIVGKGVGILADAVSQKRLGNTVILREEIGVEANRASGDAMAVPSGSLIELYRAADLYVMPSLLETFGMVLIEAMAAGIPVVTTDAPGCRDVVQEGINGLKAKAGDAASLAQCVARVLENAELKETLIENATRSAQEHDWGRVVSQYERLYENLVRG